MGLRRLEARVLSPTTGGQEFSQALRDQIEHRRSELHVSASAVGKGCAVVVERCRPGISVCSQGQPIYYPRTAAERSGCPGAISTDSRTAEQAARPDTVSVAAAPEGRPSPAERLSGATAAQC